MILERNFNFPTTRMRNSGKNWTEGMRMYPMNINLISYTRCIVQMWKIFFHPVYTAINQGCAPHPDQQGNRVPRKIQALPRPAPRKLAKSAGQSWIQSIEIQYRVITRNCTAKSSPLIIEDESPKTASGSRLFQIQGKILSVSWRIRPKFDFSWQFLT